MKKILILILIVFMAGIAGAASFGLSSTRVSTGQQAATFQTYYSSSDIDTYWPILADKEQCKSRQDFLLQVAPGGCSPMVVRSDLLAEQNVPVFCQIDALQVNPLLNIKEIKNIRFSGSYPKDVVGTGFHPARAALLTRDKLLGDPLINNIGYVVVVLKKNPKESELPDSVNLTLSGQVEYNSGNALGIGNTEFILMPMTDEQWNSEKSYFSFWRGKYYVRLDSVDANYATVSLYDGDKKISMVRVERGKTSDAVYMPGYYCQAGVKIAYDGFVDAKTNARITIGSDGNYESVEVYQGSRFLNDKCSVLKITKDLYANTGSVEVSCTGGERFTLNLKPFYNEAFSALLNKDGSMGGFSTDGDYYSIPIGGTTYAIKISEKTKLYKIEDSRYIEVDNQNILEALKLHYEISKPGAKDKNVIEIKDEILSGDAEEKFQTAIKAFENVAEDYPNEKQADLIQATIAEDSLRKAYELAKDTKKKKGTELRILNKLVENYPNSENIGTYQEALDKIYSVDDSLSGKAVFIDGKARTINLVSIRNPEKRSSAEFSSLAISGLVGKEGEDVNVGNEGLKKIHIEKIIDEDSVQVKPYCNANLKEGTTLQAQPSKTLRIGDKTDVCNVKLKLEDVKLEKTAKIRLLPDAKGTTTLANLTIKIGIEKRNIQLSPEKTLEMIKNLNESIKKWDSISKKLANVVKGMKAACFATSAVLTAKNFISGFSGASVARQQTMQGEFGWTKKCQGMIDNDRKYKTLTQCYNDNRQAIENEVSARTKVIQDVNAKLAAIEKPHTTPGDGLGGLISGSSVNREKSFDKFVEQLEGEYPGDAFIASVKGNKAIASYENLRDWYAAKKLESSVPSAKSQVEDIQAKVAKNKEILAKYEADRGAGGLKAIVANPNARVLTGDVYTITTSNGVTKIGSAEVNGADIKGFTSAALVRGYKSNDDKKAGTNSGDYLVVGKDNNGELSPEKIYKYEFIDGNIKLTSAEVDFKAFYDINKIAGIRGLGCGGLKENKIVKGENMKVRFFETGPDKGMPAQVPFDTKNGWYVKVRSSLSVGNQIGAYDASGLPKSWIICNVGSNGQINEDDECQRVDAGVSSSATLLCLDVKESQRVITESQIALTQAAQQAKNERISLKFSGRTEELEKGNPMTAFDGVQCQDFMSATDCQILFNVCDPVICPATRCDLGGQYRVSDVIQSGIVGSALLCLPNWNEGVFMPVCLTGIQAGIDGYVSIMKNHRDCLQENLNSGRMTGICDEIYSVYLCEFFWRQLAPIANIVLPKIVEYAYGQHQSARGGGEYATVMGAWQNTKKSIDYFTQVYAVNSLKAFNMRSVEEVGGEFCKGFISAKAPTAFESLIEPDSPTQFHAYFDSTPFTSATVPATSQYKVFYHIFAGKDAGVYYSVYLKNPPESIYYANAPYVQVADGYIQRGQYDSDTKDFTAPEGYKELCVRINNQEKCGFKQVSTSFAVNYLKDEFAKQELTDTKITSESECISGNAGNIGNLLQPNIQSGISETALPQASNRGIVRICATSNPGSSTEPLRYQEVGSCGGSMKCWLDKRSVSNAITDENIGAKNATLEILKQSEIKDIRARAGALSDSEVAGLLNDKVSGSFSAKVIKFENDYKDSKDTSKIINERGFLLKSFDDRFGLVLQNVVMNHQKAQIALLKARVEAVVARVFLNALPSGIPFGGSASEYDQYDYPGSENTQIPSGGNNRPNLVNQETIGETIVSYGFKEGTFYMAGDAKALYANNVELPIYIKGDSVFLRYYQGKTIITEIGGISGDKINIDFDKFNAIKARVAIDSGVEEALNNINGKEDIVSVSGSSDGLTFSEANGYNENGNLYLSNVYVDGSHYERFKISSFDYPAQKVTSAAGIEYNIKKNQGKIILEVATFSDSLRDARLAEVAKVDSILKSTEEKIPSGGFVFHFDDGTWSKDSYYKYEQGKWYSTYYPNKEWFDVGGAPENYFDNKNDYYWSQWLKGKSFNDGLNLLIGRTLANDEGGWFSNTALITDKVTLEGKTGQVIVQASNSVVVAFIFSNDEWAYRVLEGENYPLPKNIGDLLNEIKGMNKVNGILVLFGENLNS